VLIEHLKELQNKGSFKSMRELILQGSRDRLRPVLLTAAAAAMGFLPMAISSGAGAEVQRPLATVVIGGLVTSTMLTMIALPLLFEIFNNVKGLKFRPFKVIRTKTLVIFFLLSGISFSLAAQQNSLNLEQIKEIAFKNNYQLRSYELSVDESKVLQKTALDFDKTSLYYEYDQNNIADNGYPLKIVGLEQNFKFPSQYTNQFKANKISTEIKELELQKFKIILERELSIVYNELVLLMSKKNVYQMIDSLYLNIESKASKSFTAGEIDYLNYLNITAKKQKSENDLIKINNEIKITSDKLSAIMNYNMPFIVDNDSLIQLQINLTLDYNNIDSLISAKTAEYYNSVIDLNKQQFAPDFDIGYFYGTNQYDDNKSYHGFMIGLNIPLFWTKQNAELNASKISYKINQAQTDDKLFQLNSKKKQLLLELEYYSNLIQKFEINGRKLSEQIIYSAQISFENGEIDYFTFVSSMDNALNSLLFHYENIAKYNSIVLELKFLTL
jgi:cobalt-zinc-cadmium resistance protein CzcA